MKIVRNKKAILRIPIEHSKILSRTINKNINYLLRKIS